MIQSYTICHRSVWFLMHGIEAAQDHPFLEIGRVITQESYSRSKREIEIDNLKIDLVRKEGEEVVVAEIKKTSRAKKSARLQLAFYLYRLKEKGLITHGELLFPKEKKKERVELTSELEKDIQLAMKGIDTISQMEKPPELKPIPYCHHCAYNDFCWS